ncbi:MAG: hypothetical protein FD123_2293 [Bacteroidetes bacterium]|nr:MAG: hypothetical protein FD123_2293 [Bacteroidota bacterium]
MKKILQSVSTALIVLGGAASLDAQSSMNITLADQLSTPGNQTLANICGYVDGANEYALLGADAGMIIVDVTVPTNVQQIVQIPMVSSLWKEIKVYGNYAYITTEGNGGALQIVDLSALPATSASSYNYYTYTGDGAIAGQLSTVHALHIDTTQGYLYLFGSNIGAQGALILDLNTDPYNPTYVGQYSANGYVHDGYVDNDTLYAGHIYTGNFCIVDCTNKTAPVVLATQGTPTAFTHNTWLSDDRKYIFTTDENTNSYLTSYDVSNPGNVTELDRIQSFNPGSGSIVHNTHILNNWAVTSWYRDGVTIVDVTRPHNLVTVGYYDTYNGTGNGFDGAWGVYPFLPSGTMVVSNINEGLFVLSPTYVRACYVEGNITDSLCGTALSGVTVTIGTVNVTDLSDIAGDYATGTATPGTYTVTFSKPGYITKVYNNVSFTAGVVNFINVQLNAQNAVSLTGQVTDAVTTNGIGNIDVNFTGLSSFTFTTNGTGNFSSCGFPSDTYTVTTGAWGYVTQCNSVVVNTGNSNVPLQLQPGWYDDFSFNFGWTETSTASAGTWERGLPQGTFNNSTPSNPGADVTTDCMGLCYVTGNAGGSASSDDIDGGYTTLTSPVFDLTNYTNPVLEYDRWFYNGGGSGNPNDSLVISLTNGTTTVVLETVTANSPNSSSWVHQTYNISSLLTPTATMQFIARAADAMPGHLVEAGLDAFNVHSTVSVEETSLMNGALQAFPNPFTGNTQIRYNLGAEPVQGAQMLVTDLAGRAVSSIALSSKEGSVNFDQPLAGGIYLVQLVNGNKISKPLKIVKTH